jgi:FkbM family methyltransferase
VGSHLNRTGKIRHIHSFEANPKLIPLIRETHRLNGVSSDVVHGMVQSTAGEAGDFYVPADFWAASSKPNSRAEKISCPLFSLQNLVETIKPSFLMVDIEGGERELFAGLESLGTVQRILIEIHQPMIGRAGILAFFRDMSRLGFVYDQKYSTGKVLVLQHEGVPL